MQLFCEQIPINPGGDGPDTLSPTYSFWGAFKGLVSQRQPFKKHDAYGTSHNGLMVWRVVHLNEVLKWVEKGANISALLYFVKHIWGV